VLTGPIQGMYLSMPDLWRPSYALGTYERHVVRAMRRYISPGSVAYDIGANIGYFTLVLARLVGDSGTVHSFEPDPANLRALESNLRQNRIDNVRVVPSVVSNATGVVTFATFRYSLVNHIANAETPSDAQLVTVPSITLDDFIYRQGNAAPAFVKIDVEGAEDRVFRGAERTLREKKPAIIAEVRAGGIYEEICHQLGPYGYTACVLGAGAKRMARTGLADILFLPDDRKSL
jgi:FkbM family methyltransferase